MYGKLFRQMFRGTLASVGPWQALVTFQQFIILADAGGIVDMTADAIARETTIPLEVIKIGIETLERPDPESRSPDHEGRRIIRLNDSRSWGWHIVNYAHYRKLRSEEEKREYHRQYWHEKRSPKLKETQTTQTNSIDSTHAEEDAVSSKKKKPREERADALVLHASLPIKEWEEWLEHRKVKRWPRDVRTLGKHLAALAKHTTAEQCEMIDTSINAGWQGLFPPKGAAKKTMIQKVTWHPSMGDD